MAGLNPGCSLMTSGMTPGSCGMALLVDGSSAKTQKRCVSLNKSEINNIEHYEGRVGLHTNYTCIKLHTFCSFHGSKYTTA
jgi:hypothetical protein